MREEGEPRSILEPIERMSEIIFGLLMALSFTGTMSASVAGGEKVVSVLMAALSCNVAWGIVDAVMFVLTSVIERIRRRSFVMAIRTLPMAEAERIFGENLPPEMLKVVAATELEALLKRVKALPKPPERRLMGWGDVKAACAICALVVLSTLPPSLPFLFVDDLKAAMRLSNIVALVMLFAIGAQLGNYANRKPWPMAFATASIGGVLVAVTIALGG